MVSIEKKEPLQVARETNHSPEAVQRYCLHFNKVKWCVENGMSKQEITIVTGMKSHFSRFAGILYFNSGAYV